MIKKTKLIFGILVEEGKWRIEILQLKENYFSNLKQVTFNSLLFVRAQVLLPL